VGAKGLAGLNHRSVAAEADVPLGPTTYHLATLDELMVAALRQAGDGGGVRYGPPAAGVGGGAGPQRETGGAPVRTSDGRRVRFPL
jgi:hypothetical protein